MDPFSGVPAAFCGPLARLQRAASHASWQRARLATPGIRNAAQIFISPREAEPVPESLKRLSKLTRLPKGFARRHSRREMYAEQGDAVARIDNPVLA